MPLVMLTAIPSILIPLLTGHPQDVPVAIWDAVSAGWFRFAYSTMLANGLAGVLFSVSLAHGLGSETSRRGHRGLLGCISFSIAYLIVRPTISHDADLSFVKEVFVGISGYVVGATIPKAISNYLLQEDGPQASRP